MTDIKTIGVVGAGQMGNGIAHVCALAGYDVLMNDISQDALDKGIATIEKNMTRQVSRDMISVDEMKAAQARIQTSTDSARFDVVDLAIEAATENREIKEKIFAGLCKVVPAHAILATNTSSISVAKPRMISISFINGTGFIK